jgi:hypothetical protein
LTMSNSSHARLTLNSSPLWSTSSRSKSISAWHQSHSTFEARDAGATWGIHACFATYLLCIALLTIHSWYIY